MELDCHRSGNFLSVSSSDPSLKHALGFVSFWGLVPLKVPWFWSVHGYLLSRGAVVGCNDYFLVRWFQFSCLDVSPSFSEEFALPVLGESFKFSMMTDVLEAHCLFVFWLFLSVWALFHYPLYTGEEL